MPDDTGGPAFREGPEHGGADGEFEQSDELAAVVFDDAFVHAAAVHEPTADERIAAAVEARMRERPPAGDRLLGDIGFAAPPDGPHAGHHGAAGAHAGALGESCAACEAELRHGARTAARNHRMVAWVLAVVMGLGVLALAVSAVYRSTSTAPATQPVDRVPAGNGQVGPGAGARLEPPSQGSGGRRGTVAP
ncbi:hypothetical protein BIV57_09230 [Mangrovactinospora gilvigrisea]|uniref:Uncharacterized protein n=1 Tax=Mangrovactinospora gilvigrisea TaxID=1428644 RepID=A0A1J7C897_9ACTN|nr:hypothetical protein [Mangrovactinospora gilvigrisea]OIV37748.1 hypothetical protein BIV57_09230 [Mangrovactinospora gilvigrisea]